MNPKTTIRYGIHQKSHVAPVVYDTLGQLISTLVDGMEEAGYHEVKFDSSNLASAVHLYRLQVRPLGSAIGRDSKSGAGNFVQTRKRLWLR